VQRHSSSKDGSQHLKPYNKAREEVRRYQIIAANDRRTLIDALMSYFERHALIQDFIGRSHDTERVADEDKPVTAASMRQVLLSVTEDILRHRELQNQ